MLTEKICESATPAGKKSQIIWDDKIKGFGLRVLPTQKNYVLKFRDLDRKIKMHSLGKYGTISLKTAREIALQKLASVSHLKKMGKFGVICEDFLHYSKSFKQSYPDDFRRARKYLRPWYPLCVTEITHHMCDKLNREIGNDEDKKGDANLTLALISVIFNRAKKIGLISDAVINPARHVPRFAMPSRDRWATQDEVKRIFESLQHEKNYIVRDGIKLYLLTGVRRRELLNLMWCDIDFKNQILRVTITKTKSVNYIPITDLAIDIFKSMPRFESALVFPNMRTGKPFENIYQAFYRVCKRAGVYDLTIHDLRRTCGSWLAQNGESLHVIAGILGHKDPKTTAKIYARFSADSKKSALNKLDGQITALMPTK